MRQNPRPLMLFAAGFGSRMGQLTANQPKPLLPVAGKPLIDHALTVAEAAGCMPIVANLHYKPDRLAAHLEDRGVKTVLESPHILDTGGGLRHALPLLGTDPLFTMNSDAIWSGPNALDLLNAAWNPARMDALLMTVPLDRAVGRQGGGDFSLAADGRLTRGPEMVYCGVQIIKTDRLADFPEPAFSLNRLWDVMQAQGRLFGLQYPGTWCDVGHPEGITLAEEMLENAGV